MPSFKSYQEKTRKGQQAQLKASVKRAEDAGTLIPESERFVGIEPDVKPIPYRSSPEEKERMRVVSKMMPTFERFKQFQTRTRTLPVTEREPGRTEPSKPNELPGRDIPVIGHVLRALDYLGEHGPSGAAAEYAQPEPLREEFLRANHQEPATGVNKFIGQVVAPFVQPGGGVGVGVNSLYRGAGAALNKLAPGLERSLGGRVAGEAIRDAAVGAPTAGAQALTRTGDTEQAAKEAALGGGVGALGGVAGPLIGAGARRGLQSFKEYRRMLQKPAEVTGVQPSTEKRPTLPTKVTRPATPAKKEPVNLNELVKSRGFNQTTPETIAETYNGKTWYHGTGTDKLTAQTLDPFVGSHESLFGQGVYLTDDPEIAKGYAKSRGRRGTPTVYESNVKLDRVLDLEKPITPEVSEAVLNAARGLEFHDGGYISGVLADEIEKGATAEQVISKLRQEVGDLSSQLMVPTSEFVETFQDLAINLKNAGYDGITHTGGHRTGSEARRVLILLDPQNHYGSTPGPRQVTKFDRYNPEPAYLMRVHGGLKKKEPQAVPSVVEEQVPAQPMKGNWFTNLFGDVGVGITPFGSSKRVGNKPLTTKDAIVNKAIKNDRDSIGAEIAAGARATYQNFVDALSPLKRVSSDTYDTAMDAARANMLANNIIGKDFVTPEGVRIGDGLETIFKKVARGRDNDFIDYLILRDAETRVSRGERVYDESLGMTPEKIAERIQMYNKRHPEFSAIAKDWDTFTKNVRETFGLNEGLLNEAQIAAMEESRPFYTPMRRQFNRSEKPGRKYIQNTSGASFSGQKAPIKKVSPTGSVRGIVDPRKTMIEAVGSFSNAAMRNRAMQQVFKAIQENPEGMRGIAEIVPETAEASKRSLDELNTILESDGMEGVLERLNSDFDLAFKKGAQKGGDENIVRAMINGNPVKIRVHDPEVVKALTAMSPQQSGLIIDLLTAFSNATKRGATGALAPLFAARSVTVDLMQALIQSRNPARHGVDLVHAIFSSIGDKLGIPGLRNLAREYRLSGGGYSAALRGERKLNKGLSRLKRDPILSPQNIGRQTLRAAASPIKLGEAISDVSENVNRIAAYKDTMRRLGGERTPENVRKAINASREITTNFSRKGAHSKELEALFPYQNAAVQGTYRIMRGFKDHPVKTTAAVFALAIAPKLAEYAHFHDDPDYQKIPARERMRNLIISKNNDGTFVKIPMDPAYNSFGEMTIQTMRYLKDNDPEAFKGTLDALANAWTPPLLTGALQGATQGSGIEGSIGGTLNAMSPAPVFATAYNQSFTGAPIVPQRLQDRSAKNQFDERTSFPAKWIGEKLGLAPMKVDYLLRAYGGDSARLLLPLTSDMGAGTTRNTLLKNFIVDPEFTNTLADDFYSAKEKFINAKADQEVGDPLPVWYTAELDKLITSRAKGMPYRRITDLTAKKREVTGNRGLSAADKAQQLRDIQTQINEIYLDVNSKLSTAGVPMPNR